MYSQFMMHGQKNIKDSKLLFVWRESKFEEFIITCYRKQSRKFH